MASPDGATALKAGRNSRLFFRVSGPCCMLLSSMNFVKYRSQTSKHKAFMLFKK
jgi:hypothetical protein